MKGCVLASAAVPPSRRHASVRNLFLHDLRGRSPEVLAGPRVQGPEVVRRRGHARLPRAQWPLHRMSNNSPRQCAGLRLVAVKVTLRISSSLLSLSLCHSALPRQNLLVLQSPARGKFAEQRCASAWCFSLRRCCGDARCRPPRCRLLHAATALTDEAGVTTSPATHAPCRAPSQEADDSVCSGSHYCLPPLPIYLLPSLLLHRTRRHRFPFGCVAQCYRCCCRRHGDERIAQVCRRPSTLVGHCADDHRQRGQRGHGCRKSAPSAPVPRAYVSHDSSRERKRFLGVSAKKTKNDRRREKAKLKEYKLVQRAMHSYSTV